MSQKLRKQVAMLLCMLMMLSCVAGTMNVSANTENPYIEVTNLTSTSVTINWQPLVQAYYAEGKVVDSVKVTLDPSSYPEQVLAEATTKAGVNLSNLVPGEYYQIHVEPSYHLESDASITATGFDWTSFTTPAAAVQTPATTTQAPVITTQAPIVTTQAPVVTQTPAFTVSTPKITKVQMLDTQVVVTANSVTASGYEFRVCTKKGKVVKTDDLASTGTIMYNIPANKVYYVQVRAYDYDASYNKVYSSWSAKKFFVAQPTINTTKSKVNKHSISLKWNKVKNATSYMVYVKKTTSSKWTKVKTTKKNSYTVRSLKGSSIDAVSNDYNVRIVATAKVKGKTIKSDKSKTIKTYTYTYYR